jgi:putative transposase
LKRAGFSQNKTLELIGLSKASYQYRSKPRPRLQNPIPQRQRPHPAALTGAEDEQILRLLRCSKVSVAETFYRHLDDGDYIASMSSFHRRARREKIPMAATGTRRRRSKERGSAPTPVLSASGPGQVVCWDISFLPGPYRSVSYALYLIIDLFSRLIVGWSIQERENKLVAAGLMDQVLTSAGSILTVHSDNGGAMTSTTMRKTLNKHHAAQSLIRPGVSNDNAQIESLFRTVKYGPTWPGVFTDIQHANTWFAQFVEAYNTEHHHTGLAGFTPAQVHDGTWQQVAHRRQATLDAAFLANPGRYRHRPQVPTPPQRVTLNLGHNDGKNHTPPTLLELLAG